VLLPKQLMQITFNRQHGFMHLLLLFHNHQQQQHQQQQHQHQQQQQNQPLI